MQPQLFPSTLLEEAVTLELGFETLELGSDALAGELRLFALAPVTRTPVEGPPTTTVGTVSERVFEGYAVAWGLPKVWKASDGQEGFDFIVNGWQIQVKGTRAITRRGYLRFQAGEGKRFADYAGHADYFAFVYIGRNMDLYNRMVFIHIDEVLRRCPGSEITFRPEQFPKEPSLSALESPKPPD